MLQTWPEGGPKLVWQTEGLGTWYSTVSIVGGRIYTMGDIPDEAGAKTQCVIALDLQTRKRVWSAKVGRPHTDGSRCTPTVTGGLVYALGTFGDLVCLSEKDGSEVWRASLEKDYGAAMMSQWQYSESPLVDGEKLIVTPGAKDATVVALNRKTGELIWKCAAGDIGPNGADGAGYSSVVMAEVGGTRLYVQSYGRGVIGVEAGTGKLLWSYNRVACGTANIMTPIVKGPLVFVSNAYRAGAACLRMEPSEGGIKATEVYFLEASVLQNHHGGMVLVGDYVYGGHGQNAGAPICVELATGKVMWKEQAPVRGSAAVLYADNRLYFRYENGTVVLIGADPTTYAVHGTLEEPRVAGPAWAHPVVLNGRMYLRHNDMLFCYDVKRQ